MAELNDPVEAPDVALTRLEAALDRIGRSARPAPPPSELAVRLDTLIARVRGALDEATA